MTENDSWLSTAVETASNATTEFRTFLGVQQEAHVCPECNTACQESSTYNPDTAAFDGGACPSWECPDCGQHYVREQDDNKYSIDLYGQGL